jgi:hypothetical protein
MRTILVGNCEPNHLYSALDPDGPSEVEFESQVVQALSCIYPNYRCIVFGGGFKYEGAASRPDLALVAKDFSHWFVIEVELVSHSFEGHVLPQVRAFVYGDYQPECATVLSRELSVPIEIAKTLLEYVPRSVAVIANRHDSHWRVALGAHGVQLLTVSTFESSAGIRAFEIEGTLEVLKESLGWGQYSATDRSLRFPPSIKLPLGSLQINDPVSSLSSWNVTRDESATWITKATGTPDIPNGSYVQLIRTMDGRLSIRRTDGSR